MALALTNKLAAFYKGGDIKQKVETVFNRIVTAKWISSGLKENNAFTTTLVLRVFGFLAEKHYIASDDSNLKKAWVLNSEPVNGQPDLSLPKIAESMAQDPEQFAISAYRPSAAIVYWFVDGLSRAQTSLASSSWDRVCDWAVSELNQQRSLVTAGHDAMMDPVAMAMAACLCARLRRISTSQNQLGMTNSHLAKLPSIIELEHSIQEAFKTQGKSGIWPKYFPLFHYREAGSNFCFTFELVEAVLHEFGPSESGLFDSLEFLEGLVRAVTWCEKNHLKWSDAGKEYPGWNSGGNIQTLRKGQPESWATAVVYMFLQELYTVLGRKIQNLLLETYKAKVPTTRWENLADVEVKLPERTLKNLIEVHVINHAEAFDPEVNDKMSGRRSVLLFGPPGTAKTQLARAVAAKLKWRLIELDPSNFLSHGIENIYKRAEDIFADLGELTKVVVLFDEMDALVQRRAGSEHPLDVTSRFLTTSMLPKLAKLHDNGKLVFFFATNFFEDFDSAIKRPGRFDILVCVGPPKWATKLESLEGLLPNVKDHGQRAAIKTKLQEFTKSADSKQKDLLDLLTFKETQTFLERFLGSATDPIQPSEEFFKQLSEFAVYMTLPPEDTSEKSECTRFREQQGLSRVQ